LYEFTLRNYEVWRPKEILPIMVYFLNLLKNEIKNMFHVFIRKFIILHSKLDINIFKFSVIQLINFV
jgi:hypothetical protein